PQAFHLVELERQPRVARGRLAVEGHVEKGSGGLRIDIAPRPEDVVLGRIDASRFRSKFPFPGFCRLVAFFKGAIQSVRVGQVGDGFREGKVLPVAHRDGEQFFHAERLLFQRGGVLVSVATLEVAPRERAVRRRRGGGGTSGAKAEERERRNAGRQGE